VPVHRRGGVGALLVVHHLVLVPAQPAVGAARQHPVGFGMAGDVAGVQRTRETVVVDEGVAGVDAVRRRSGGRATSPPASPPSAAGRWSWRDPSRSRSRCRWRTPDGTGRRGGRCPDG
ncbi:hypothetical protein GBAR_LOCUS8109, partial [Geodia barretti]